MFIRDHPYPDTIEGVQSLIGQPTPPFYTEAIHKEFAKVYKYVSKNTFKVYGRELGILLYEHGETNQNGKGMDLLRSSLHILLKVLTSHPLIAKKDRDQCLIAESMARQTLDFAWDGIGNWMF